MENLKSIYNHFLRNLEKIISDQEFQKRIEQMRNIDKNHYTENILIDELKNIISEYMEKDIVTIDNIKKVQIILPGNPEIVFRLGIEAVRNNVKMIINIDDFCLAQDTLLIEAINSAANESKLSKIVELKNLIKDEDIFNVSKTVDSTVCVGNSNDFNRLNKKYKIPNLKFYPFNIFELYSDSYELEEVRKGLYDYAMRNQFEMEIYDIELDIDEVINEMNKYGYGFCSILLSKDKEKIKKFKENIKSKYVCVNENPFKVIKFEFDLTKI